jgi:hypothetical protein
MYPGFSNPPAKIYQIQLKKNPTFIEKGNVQFY